MQGTTNHGFSHNGLGDRLRQTVGGTPTNYTLDLAVGLTQVLSDGTNAYLYGNARIGEEQPGGWEYHLGDALGSVRQLVDASASVTLSRAYEPFGNPLLTTGTGSSIYGFTGEQRDGTGLVYLRARYYAPTQGRFLTIDLWEGDPNQPMSYNAWLYARGNPILLTDPSGLWYCIGHDGCRDWLERAFAAIRSASPRGMRLVRDFEEYDEGVTRRQTQAWTALIASTRAGALTPSLSCGARGFLFAFTAEPPGGRYMLTRPWAIYVWEENLDAAVPEHRYAMLGHELHHLVQQDALLAISIQGELLAAQFEARLDIAMGVGDLPRWLKLPDDRTVEDLRPNFVQDLEMWRDKGHYYWWQPLAPQPCSLIWPEGHLGQCPSPVPTPGTPTPTPRPPTPP